MDPEIASPTASEALARAGWEALQERLIAGFCHDVNGRLAALHGLVFLVETGEPIPPGFDKEVERLEGVVHRMVELTGNIEAAPAPMGLVALLDRALHLHGGVKDLDGGSIEPRVEGDLPAVLVNERFSVRLLLLFVDAAWRAMDGPSRTLVLSGTKDSVEIAFHADGSRVPAGLFEALADAAAIEGGRVYVEDERHALELPSLSRSRAQGR